MHRLKGKMTVRKWEKRKRVGEKLRETGESKSLKKRKGKKGSI